MGMAGEVLVVMMVAGAEVGIGVVPRGGAGEVDVVEPGVVVEVVEALLLLVREGGLRTLSTTRFRRDMCV